MSDEDFSEVEAGPEQAQPASPSTDESSGKSSSVKLGVGAAALVALLYVVLWPLVPSVTAQHIDNPMGEDFAIAGVEQSMFKKITGPRLSQELMCETVQAWASIMKENLECGPAGPHTRGQVIEDDDEEDATDYLWSEILMVKDTGAYEVHCFVSQDGGRSWDYGTGIYMMGLFPIQHVSPPNCGEYRAFTYGLKDDAELVEELDPEAPRPGEDYPYYVPQGDEDDEDVDEDDEEEDEEEEEEDEEEEDDE